MIANGFNRLEMLSMMNATPYVSWGLDP